MLVRLGADHPRVAIAEDVVADRSPAEGGDRARQLRGADLGQPRAGLVVVEGRIVDLALGAIGAGDEVDADALGHEPRDGAAGGHRLVVGMGVDEQDAAGCAQPAWTDASLLIGSSMVASASRASRSPMAAAAAICPNWSAFILPSRGAMRRSGGFDDDRIGPSVRQEREVATGGERVGRPCRRPSRDEAARRNAAPGRLARNAGFGMSASTPMTGEARIPRPRQADRDPLPWARRRTTRRRASRRGGKKSGTAMLTSRASTRRPRGDEARAAGDEVVGR